MFPLAVGDRFEELGYEYLPGLLGTADVSPVRAAVLRALQESPVQVVHDAAWLRVQARVLADEAVRALVEHPAVQGVVRARSGRADTRCGDIVRIMPQGSWTRPHQDGAYLRAPDAITLWIALEDTPLERGPLVLWAGSHHQGLREHGPGEEGTQVPEDAEWHGSPLAAGDAIAFSALTVHASLPNLGAAPRLSIDLRSRRG